MRAFSNSQATRDNTPVWLGLTGASGSGKTFSALRIATGMQRVIGGEVFVIDTEARRSLHYADKFKFQHVEFASPFGPLDYLAAVQHCVSKGAGVIVIDSMSHEHEGPGGVLEIQAQEVERLSHGDAGKAERVKMLAWAKPKSERRRLINTLLQLRVSMVFCFRAKEKIEVRPGSAPKDLGWMPVAGEEFVYEMTSNALLYPAAGGVPSWSTQEAGERKMVKLPQQFQGLLDDGKPLSEEHGEAMAQWAMGGTVSNRLAQALEAIATTKDLEGTKASLREMKWTRGESDAIRAALEGKAGA